MRVKIYHIQFFAIRAILVIMQAVYPCKGWRCICSVSATAQAVIARSGFCGCEERSKAIFLDVM